MDDNKFKILIVGRSGTGKDFLGEQLQKLGYTGVKSYTTRPKRSEDEDTHIFVTAEEAKAIPDKVCVTNINWHEYFTTPGQMAEHDYFIIDPKGVKEITKSLPDTCFVIVYVEADPEQAEEMAASRSITPEEERKTYRQRRWFEDEQFSEFEKKLRQVDEGDYHNWLGEIPNICTFIRYRNQYKEDETREVAYALQKAMGQYAKILRLMPAFVKTGDVYSPEPGRLRMYYHDGAYHDDSYEVFAGHVLFSDEGRLLFYDSLLIGPNSYDLKENETDFPVSDSLREFEKRLQGEGNALFV